MGYFQVKTKKVNNWIQRIKIRFDAKSHVKQKILNFWIKFVQKGSKDVGMWNLVRTGLGNISVPYSAYMIGIFRGRKKFEKLEVFKKELLD